MLYDKRDKTFVNIRMLLWVRYLLAENNGEAIPTTQAAKSIKAIDRTTVHKICSGQVCT